jgi:hypothetical protein
MMRQLSCQSHPHYYYCPSCHTTFFPKRPLSKSISTMYLPAAAGGGNDIRGSNGRWSAIKFTTTTFLLTVSSSTFLLAPSQCAMASPSSSSGSSWWDDMKFDDTFDTSNASTEQHNKNVIVSVGGPMLQVPCGLMIVLTAMDDHATITTTTNPFKDVVLPLSTIIDTSLSVSTIQSHFLQQYPQLQALVQRRVTGGASDETSPPQLYLPYGTLQLRMGSVEATVVAPALQIVNFNSTTTSHKNDQHSDSWELRLGLDFLRLYQARLDLGEEEESLQLRISSTEQEKGKVVSVPLIRPRPSLHFGDQDNGEL